MEWISKAFFLKEGDNNTGFFFIGLSIYIDELIQ